MKAYLIYGAGGHANVLADLIGLSGATVLAMFSDQLAENDPLIRPYQPEAFPGAPLVLGIGSNEVRQRLSALVSHKFATLLHPAASVASNVTVGEGSVVLAKAVVQTNSVIGKHVIINAGAVVEHDAIVGDFAHIAGNAYIGGGAVIGTGALVGQGAVIMRNVVINPGQVVPPLTVLGN